MGSPLLEKTKVFALEVIKVCNFIRGSKKEAVLTNQLVREPALALIFGRRFMPTGERISLRSCKLR